MGGLWLKPRKSKLPMNFTTDDRNVILWKTFIDMHSFYEIDYINTPQIQLFPYSYVFYLCDKKLILYKAKSTSCSEIHLGYVR